MNLNLFKTSIQYHQPIGDSMVFLRQNTLKYLSLGPWIRSPLVISDNPPFVQCGEESRRLGYNHQEVPVLRGDLPMRVRVYVCAIFGLTYENEKHTQPKGCTILFSSAPNRHRARARLWWVLRSPSDVFRNPNSYKRPLRILFYRVCLHYFWVPGACASNCGSRGMAA